MRDEGKGREGDESEERRATGRGKKEKKREGREEGGGREGG